VYIYGSYCKIKAGVPLFLDTRYDETAASGKEQTNLISFADVDYMTTVLLFPGRLLNATVIHSEI